MSRTNTLLIKTPEGIVFSQLLAGPLSRFLAWLLDLACVSLICSLLRVVLTLLIFIHPDLARALTILAYFAVSIGYGITTEWYWRGQTLGKRVLRLRVVDANGLRLQFSQVVIRNLLRFIDMLPVLYLVGGLACLISRRAQRLGDLAANTVVIRTPKIAEPDLDQLLSGKYNSLRDYPHLAARLRQKVSPSEAGITLQAILRRDLLDPEARVALFQELTAHLRTKVEFPPDATQNITDEQFVRNAVDVLYRTQGLSPPTQPQPHTPAPAYEPR